MAFVYASDLGGALFVEGALDASVSFTTDCTIVVASRRTRRQLACLVSRPSQGKEEVGILVTALSHIVAQVRRSSFR